MAAGAHRFEARSLVVMALAAVSGAVDGLGWLSLDQIYTTHMTGNSNAFARAVAQLDAHEIARRGLLVAGFVVGAVVGASVAELCARRRVRSMVAPGLAITAVVLGAFSIWADVAARAGRFGNGPAWIADAQGALVSLAMGVQTATFRRVDGTTVRTTFITGMLSNFGEEIGELIAGERKDRGTTVRRLVAVGVVWPAFVLGGVAATVGYARWHVYALWVPIAVLAVLGFTDLVVPLGGPSGDAAWRREQRRTSE